MKYKILMAGLFMASLCISTSCSDEVLQETTPEVDGTIDGNATLSIVDQAGNPVQNVSNKYGTYYVKVDAEGEWELNTESAFLVPAEKKGYGPALVSLAIGNNWGEARQGGITLITQSTGVSTRAEANTRTDVNQDANSDIKGTMALLSSNKGTGYSYLPNTNYCLGTHIQIFNMSNLDSLQKANKIDYIKDELFPQVEEQVITASSQEALSQKLAVSASVNLNFNAFSLDVNGAYGSSTEKRDSMQYAVKRMKSYQYTREINYYNILKQAEDDKELEAKLFAPGFLRMKQRFEANFTGETPVTDAAKIKSLCKDFCDEVGPCFISKSVMGCVLDYYMSCSASILNDTLSVSGALDLKISAVVVHGDGKFSNAENKAISSMDAKVIIKGGDVNKISILTTGGTLKDSLVTEWQQSIEPAKAVMIDMKLVPIYELISNAKAHDTLKAYIEEYAAVKTQSTDK